MTIREIGTILSVKFRRKEGVLKVKQKLPIFILIALFSLFGWAAIGLGQAGDGHAGDGYAGDGHAGNGTVTSNTGDIFVDVPKDHWAYDDIKYLADRGIITGLPGGKYNGSQPLTRYDAAALVARAIKYMQNNPESVTPQDLDTLKDLIFKVSDRLSSLETKVNSLQGGNNSALANQVAQNKQAIASLQSQVGAMAQNDTSKLASRVNANFIISVTALLVGIIGVALATLGL